MSNNYFEEDVADDDPTDELPILTDVVLANAPDKVAFITVPPNEDATGQFAVSPHDTSQGAATRDDRAAALQQGIADRDVKLSTLEKELAGLEARWRATCTALADRDAEVARLRAALDDRDAEHDALRAKAAERAREEFQARDDRITQLSDELEASRAAAEALEENARSLERQIVELEGAQEAAGEQSQSANDMAMISRLREESATLAQHIENRNLIWHEQTAAVAEKATRIRELELELAQRLERQQAAEHHAETEANNAKEHRAKLIAITAALEEARQRPQDPTPALTDVPSSAADGHAQLRRELERAVSLQVGAGDDPAELRRLENLEAAIRELELDMDAGVAQPPLATARQREPARLICLTGEELGPYVLDDTELMIGRASHCGIRIMTHYVSREHARISITNERCVIEDAGSRNGVFVNSVRVERHKLDNNDLVTIGDTQFRYQAGDFDAA